MGLPGFATEIVTDFPSADVCVTTVTTPPVAVCLAALVIKFVTARRTISRSAVTHCAAPVG